MHIYAHAAERAALPIAPVFAAMEDDDNAMMNLPGSSVKNRRQEEKSKAKKMKGK